MSENEEVVKPILKEWLLEHLRPEFERLKSKYEALEREIKEANGVDAKKEVKRSVESPPSDIGGWKPKRELWVDRRKLKKILEMDDVFLSYYELQAIDTYLSLRDSGLDKAFEKTYLLNILTEKERTTFLIGAKPAKGGGDAVGESIYRDTTISRWDTQSLARLIGYINEASQVIHFSIEDVLLRNRRKPDERDGRNDYKWLRDKKEQWLDIIDHQINASSDAIETSLTSIGSTRSNLGTERLFSHIFGLEPFAETPERKLKSLPFYFIWPEAEMDRYPLLSCLSVRRLNQRGLIANKTEYLNNDEVTYGVISAQRQRQGLWLIIGGVTGPATLGSSLLAKGMKVKLPAARFGPKSPVCYAITRTRVNAVTDNETLGDRRRIISQEIIHGPDYWDPLEIRSA